MIVMNLDKLDVWVRAKDFAVAIYKEVAPHLPADEKWNPIFFPTQSMTPPTINHSPLTIAHSL